MIAEQDYENLVKNNIALLKELEAKKQALYDCERQKKIAETLVTEYQEEIKILQNEGSSENKKLESRIHQLEETNLNLKVSSNEHVNYLEKELENKEDEINCLKREMGEFVKIAENKRPDDEKEKLINELCDLKEQNTELCEKLLGLEHTYELKVTDNIALQETILQLTKELDNYKEILDCKKVEIAEANSLIQTLKDDFACLRAELDLVKSKPLDDKSQGNSLFAEVDDRRVQLQQNMNLMKTKYIEMKRERATLLKQITTLRFEKAALLARWESEVNEVKDDEDMILQSYKNQVQTLKDLIESYAKELKEKPTWDGLTTPGMKFFDKMLASKNQEIEALRQKLSSRSLNENLLSHDLANARREIRRYKMEILKLQNDVGQLKTQIEEMQLVSPTEKQMTVENKIQLKSIVKKEIKVEPVTVMDDTNKENDEATERKVQFCENTLEPKVTDRNRYKKGVKILTSKPIHISGIPKKVD